MKYDKDLRIARVAFTALVFLNLGILVANLYCECWMVAFAAANWAFACSMMVRMTKAQQRTRDETRIVLAMIHGQLEEREP